MTATRLEAALDAGALILRAGRVAVFAPRAGQRLDPLDPGRVQVVTGFRPDHDDFSARGFDCVRQPSGEFGAAVVVLPRIRAQARGLVAEAVAAARGGLVIVDGARTDGVDAMWRDIRARIPGAQSLPKAHGRVIWFAGAPDLSDWSQAARPQARDGWLIPPGGFSADGPDPGSALLLESLPPLAGRVADLGAGWGYLARAILARSPKVTELHLVEADAEALDCARANVTDTRARFHWTDATRPLPGSPFDMVVTNPPFHAGRAADPGLGRAFVLAAARSLTPGGVLWLVANRHLPYEATLTEAFAQVEEKAGTPGYKILCAARPRRRV